MDLLCDVSKSVLPMNNLKAAISQRLLPKIDGQGVVPAAEILVSTAMVRECIVDEHKTAEINDAIADGHLVGSTRVGNRRHVALVDNDRECLVEEVAPGVEIGGGSIDQSH